MKPLAVCYVQLIPYSRIRNGLMLRPLDLFVALKIAVSPEEAATYQRLASALGLSSSQVHRAVKSAQASGLVLEEDKTRVDRRGLLELLVGGVRHVYPATPGGATRGMPTAHSAPPLSAELSGGGPELVWPDPEGQTRGMAVEPLSRRAPAAAKRDRTFYEVLALVDALRIGRARERALAKEHLHKRLGQEKAPFSKEAISR